MSNQKIRLTFDDLINLISETLAESDNEFILKIANQVFPNTITLNSPEDSLYSFFEKE